MVYRSQIPEPWWTGQTWLQQLEQWSPQPNILANEISEKEAKAIKNLVTTSVTVNHEQDDCDRLLLKHSLWKFIRIICSISRFIDNYWGTETKESLTTEETKKQLKYCIHCEQQNHKESDKFKSNEQQLNLNINKEGLYDCQGRVEGHYLIYLPSKSLLTEKLSVSFKNYPWGNKPNNESNHVRLLRFQHWDSLQRKWSINSTVVKDLT